jgi:hypothetical protein
MSKRKAIWSFSAVWTFRGHVVATTSIDPILLQNEWQQMEIEMKRLVQQAEGFPPNVRNIELKYSLADWELALTKTPIRLSVHGYIQSKHNFSIDLYNLNRWFSANWSPVDNQLRRDPTYTMWAKGDPSYRHVQVDGEPAVAKMGRQKKITRCEPLSLIGDAHAVVGGRIAHNW